MITLHDGGGVLGWPLDFILFFIFYFFCWALTMSRSRLLAHVCEGGSKLNGIDTTIDWRSP